MKRLLLMPFVALVSMTVLVAPAAAAAVGNMSKPELLLSKLCASLDPAMAITFALEEIETMAREYPMLKTESNGALPAFVVRTAKPERVGASTRKPWEVAARVAGSHPGYHLRL